MNSIQQIQQALGVTPDGIFGNISNQALHDETGNATVIEQIQAILGVTVDGVWGPVSNGALQALLNAPASQPVQPSPSYILIADGNHNDPWPPSASIPAFIHKVSEGTFFTDPACATRMGGYTGKRGFYHFSSGDDPVAQANYFLTALAKVGYQSSDLICLDFEDSSRSDDSNMTTAGAETWIAQVEAALGCTVCVYGSDLLSSALSAGAFASQPLWPASYNANPPSLPGGRNWAIWQYTAAGSPYDDMDKLTPTAFAAWPTLPT
jgi:lysozyme